jgi:hypothetical protein
MCIRAFFASNCFVPNYDVVNWAVFIHCNPGYRDGVGADVKISPEPGGGRPEPRGQSLGSDLIGHEATVPIKIYIFRLETAAHPLSMPSLFF